MQIKHDAQSSRTDLCIEAAWMVSPSADRTNATVTEDNKEVETT